jgi:hypothetical protein
LLKEDDARFLSIEVRETIPVLLVDGRPGTTQLAGQAGFLAAALAPKAGFGREQPAQPNGEEERPFFQPKTITDADLPTESLSGFGREPPAQPNGVAIVALCNVARLSPQTWKELTNFVDRGGGLLVFAGDRIDADNYDRYGFVEGAGVVPVAFGESASAPPADAEFGLKPEALTHPIVAEFAAEPESGLFSTRVMRYVPVELPPGRGQVVLRYTNGDPALIAAPFGRGRVVVCTTTANMDWANLPARGDFVSLMLNTAAYLTPDRGNLRNIQVGDRIREPLAAEQTSLPLRVSTAGEAATEPALVPENDGLSLEYGPMEHAGPVAVSIGSTVTMFTVNVDSGESELLGIEPSALQAELDNAAQVITDVDALIEQPLQARSSELAGAALVAVCGLLFLEMWLAMQFGSGDRPRSIDKRPTRSVE